jgi:hypothetical protein
MLDMASLQRLGQRVAALRLVGQDPQLGTAEQQLPVVNRKEGQELQLAGQVGQQPQLGTAERQLPVVHRKEEGSQLPWGQE